MRAHHESLLDLYAGAIARGKDFFRLDRRHANGLFAQHVLAAFGGRNRPLFVEMIGQRVVDRIDVGVGEQLAVGAVGLRQSQSFRRRLGFVMVA